MELTQLETIAKDLLAGGPVDDRADSKADWLKAAQYAVDGDTADLEYYIARADAYEEYEAWAERHDRAGNYSFNDWYHGDYPVHPSFGMRHPDSPSFGGRW